MSARLFDEFEPVSDEQWLEVVQRDLKGADFDKRLVTETLDGVKLRPFYRAGDGTPAQDSVIRGYGREAARPSFREEIRESEIVPANRHALHSLERGAMELAVLTYPMGVPIRDERGLASFGDGIWIEAVPIHWMSGPFTRPMLGLLAYEAKRRGIKPSDLQGSVEFDPIMDRCAGWTASPFSEWGDDFKAGSEALAEYPNFLTLTIRGSLIEKAGASIAQELAFSVGLFTEYLAAAGERLDSAGLADLVRRTEFRLGIATNYFLEIAKLRAIKLLVHNVLGEFGIEGVRPRYHAITTSTNKTLYDPYNNLLRATVEAMASTVGGVDSLSVAAYDQGYGAPDEFSEHLTRNTESLLIEEAYIGRVADPLGGSYAVEHMTEEYAQAAWTLFRDMESQGGFVAAWQNGWVAKAIQNIQAKRSKQVASRRRTIVGTTVYPNPKEQRLGDVHGRPQARQVSIPLTANAGALSLKLNSFVSDVRVPTTAFDPFRPSWPFEHLRLRMERFVAIGGRRPVILLAEFGDKKMRRARSMFTQGFLGAGGYDLLEVAVAEPKELEEAIAKQMSDLVVLCSEDAAYLEFARALKTSAPVVVAGNPVDALEDLKAAGVADFIHIRLDQLETLERLHARFEIPEIPLDEPLQPEAL